MTRDRRRYPRAYELEIAATALAQSQLVAGYTIVDLSEGGARLIGPAALVVGASVCIAFDDTRGRPLAPWQRSDLANAVLLRP